MSSPNIGPGDLSTSPLTNSSARKRQTTGAPVYSPNETLNQMTREAEARHHDKYTAQKEIRAIRAKEMEKQRKEDEEKEREETNRINRAISSNNYTSTTNGSSVPKPRLYSTTTSNSRFDEPVATEDNPKELKKKLAEMDEKFKKHAMFQTQLENDNQKLIYEVDLLKDLIEEHQELIIELRRQFKEKSKELDYQKRANKDLQTDFVRLKEILKQRDALIEESGLKLYTDYEVKKSNIFKNNNINSGDNNNSVNEIKSVLPAVLLAPDTAKLLDMLGEGTIDDKLRKLFNEKQEYKEHNDRLLREIDDERQKSVQLEKKLISSMNKISDSQETSQELQEIQRQYTREINELKMKLQRVEHENIVIKQDKQRLDTQLKYLQTSFDQLDNQERRLMKEKRDAQREFRELKTKYQDALLDNKRLSDRIDSLEFYAKTNNNSSAFHNLIPSTYTTNSNSTSSTRARTPAPPSSRQRLSSTSSSLSSTNNSGINYGSTYTPSSSTTSYYEPSSYRSSSRPASRQSSVERTTSGSSNLDNYNSLVNSSFYGSTNRLSDIGSTSIRSRNSSPSRFDSSSIYGSTRNISTLPPHPTYDFRNKRETSTERSLLRNRREISQERSTPTPRTTSSVLLNKLRRSSFVDNGRF
ncbi:unnamed protein product [Brachionus calyciflorus]|uniref:Uncharacterized protein n=1 Tax=Brachionus calyciflorus TaxID=104777 RepID=A0A814HPH1_9BILA|nr:unnamed protein product [Brachionus calyciflorus]